MKRFNDDLGKFSEKVHLNTDESVPPVKMLLRRPPVAIRDRLDSELDRLLKLGVIEKVDSPTE